MIRILDRVVADWKYYVWQYNGVLIQQVIVYMFNGMVLILDYEDFMMLSDDTGW